MMQKRKLGHSGLEIAPLMFGGNVFGWTADEAMSFKLLDGFVAAGLNAIDTADVYSKWVAGHKGGESETIIGKWLKARGGRDKVVIATKVGMEMPGVGQGLRKAYILQRVEDSLKRLQTDYIDLYQSHTDDKDAPLEETLSAYRQLIKQGKVRAIGASNYNGARLAEALGVSAAKALPRYETLQPHYNLYERAGLRARPRAAGPQGRHRRHPLLLAGQRLPHGQVPHRGGLQEEPARRRHEDRGSTSAACAFSKPWTRSPRV